MRPFDLEEFKAGAVGITRDGREVHFFRMWEDAAFPISTTIDGAMKSYTSTGNYWATGEESVYDIMGLSGIAPKEDTRRYELAKEFMVAIIGKYPCEWTELDATEPFAGVARGAVAYADALLEALNQSKD